MSGSPVVRHVRGDVFELAFPDAGTPAGWARRDIDRGEAEALRDRLTEALAGRQRAGDVADLIASGVADELGWSAEEMATILGFPKPEEAKS